MIASRPGFAKRSRNFTLSLHAADGGDGRNFTPALWSVVVAGGDERIDVVVPPSAPGAVRVVRLRKNAPLPTMPIDDRTWNLVQVRPQQ